MVAAVPHADKPVLLTAFGSFTTREGTRVEHNPTLDVAAAVADLRASVITAVLPVSFGRAPIALRALFDAHSPALWIGLGVTATRPTIDLEAVALNLESATRADEDGDRPTDRPIVAGAPLALRPGWDPRPIAATLAARDLPVTVSHHAGTFLCNQAMYVGCHAAQTTGCPEVAAFVHVPLEGTSIADQAAAILSLIEHLKT